MKLSLTHTPRAFLSPALAAIALSLASSSLYADEVTDAVDEGLSAYKSGDLSTASSQLDYASGLIRQQKAESIKVVFPNALGGWEASEVESESSGGMMGAGISANREYYKGDADVSIELVMDSPMLQSMMGMINNPSMITMNGGKLVKVQGQKAIYNGDKDYPELIMIIDNNAMFTLKANGGATLDDLKAYGEALDLEAL
ncbi:hypothetical protein [uncultured Gilvimarinus sp.]|uniref:hypothetical protein n=1 Tax=uncultured Gilvimarinus sp. TaxID=1689143 RepID=UPI0030EEEE13|tara:strand:+ start:1250 stop:1849 length:600 start_codon:yes stop_codon:yes gene_type:complete